MHRYIVPQKQPLSQERRDSVFSSNIGVCASFPSRKAYRNSSKALEETLLDTRVANESAIVDCFPFCLRNRLAGNKLFI